jgi:hypothetical protein
MLLVKLPCSTSCGDGASAYDGASSCWAKLQALAQRRLATIQPPVTAPTRARPRRQRTGPQSTRKRYASFLSPSSVLDGRRDRSELLSLKAVRQAYGLNYCKIRGLAHPRQCFPNAARGFLYRICASHNRYGRATLGYPFSIFPPRRTVLSSPRLQAARQSTGHRWRAWPRALFSSRYNLNRSRKALKIAFGLLPVCVPDARGK